MAEDRAADRIRVFFALWPSDTVAAEMHRAARAAQACCGGRVMRREGLHLTLAFIGDIERARLRMLTAVADTMRLPALTLTLDHCGHWRHNRIVWLAPQTPPEELADFAGVFTEGLREADFAVDRRLFAPHVTLLRNARCEGQPPQPEPIGWEVGGFALVASERTAAGSRYRVIGQWPGHAAGR